MQYKKTFILVIVLAVVGAGLLVWAQTGGKKSEPAAAGSETLKTTQSASKVKTEDSDDTMQPKGAYVTYSPTSIAETKGTKVLFFHAPWCPQCRALDKELETKDLPENVTVIRVDYDSSQDLRKKYGVTIQTTFVRVDDEGNLVKKHVAYDEPTVDSLIKNIL